MTAAGTRPARRPSRADSDGAPSTTSAGTAVTSIAYCTASAKTYRRASVSQGGSRTARASSAPSRVSQRRAFMGSKIDRMLLPVMPPVAPMLAKSVASIPTGAMSYEPKWDGFRSIVFRDGDEVEIGSRNERPMTRYFPEVVAAVLASTPARCVIDGEIVVPGADGRRLDFEALLQRIHPAASRVRLLAEQTPAAFVAFDLLALGDDDYTGEPFARRREALE